jgi:hypothetical protein
MLERTIKWVGSIEGMRTPVIFLGIIEGSANRLGTSSGVRIKQEAQVGNG